MLFTLRHSRAAEFRIVANHRRKAIERRSSRAQRGTFSAGEAPAASRRRLLGASDKAERTWGRARATRETSARLSSPRHDYAKGAQRPTRRTVEKATPRGMMGRTA